MELQCFKCKENVDTERRCILCQKNFCLEHFYSHSDKKTKQPIEL